MKILYFDCPTGLSGDMCVASLIDLGVSPNTIRKELKKLPIGGYSIEVTKERRRTIEGTRFKVCSKETHHHRTFNDIKKLIEKSSLPGKVKDLSISMFKNLAVAEGKVHGISPRLVEFHEVGAIDSIVDIVGTAIAVNELKPDKIYSSPLPLGSGFVNTSHGKMPIPAPATLEILKGAAILPSPIAMELTTPTGAVILKTLSSGFGPMPAMTIEKTGVGVGGKDFKELPNAARVIMGEAGSGCCGEDAENTTKRRLIVMETNIDDMTPQVAGYLMEKLLARGSLDCFFTPVLMKKSRPGILLTVLTDEENKSGLMDVIFMESTSIGIRCYAVERTCLERKTEKVKTPYGVVRVKKSVLHGKVVNVQPEYEDLRAIAGKKGVPLRTLFDAAKKAAARE